MDQYAEKLKQYIKDNSIKAEHLTFDQSVHTVAEAAQAVKANESDFVKNICMIDKNENAIIAIVKGEDRASTRRVGKALDIERPKIASPEEVLEKTSYPAGGTPSFGCNVTYVIDERVLECDIVYTGGGSSQALVKISVQEMLKVNKAKVARIRK